MLTSAPFVGDTILPLADARVQLRLTADDAHRDGEVTAARDDAIAFVEREAGYSLQSRQFVWTANSFGPYMPLPIRPLVSVDSVDYYASDGTDTQLADIEWLLTGNALQPAYGKTWPTLYGRDGIRVTLTAGPPNAAAIDRDAMRAVKLAMTAYFENRDNPDLDCAKYLAHQVRLHIL